MAEAKFDEFLEEYKQKIRDLDLKTNEQNTKSNLIDFLLSHLGWDIHDIVDVEKERQTTAREFVDYALKIKGALKIYIDAKRIKDSLTNSQERERAINYAIDDKVLWCMLTNGNLFHLYFTHSKERVLEINVMEGRNVEWLNVFRKSWVAGNAIVNIFLNREGELKKKPLGKSICPNCGQNTQLSLQGASYPSIYYCDSCGHNVPSGKASKSKNPSKKSGVKRNL